MENGKWQMEEEEGVTANVEARVIHIQKAVDPPGNARTDSAIICDLARRLGRGQYFPFREPREIFEELRRASQGGIADYYGITYEKIDQQMGVFWPCPTLEHPGTPRLFEDGRFFHPDGKAHFMSLAWRESGDPVDAEFPIYLTTGRVVSQYLSGTQTRRIGGLVDDFLAQRSLTRNDIAAWVLHPGGQKLLAYMEQELGICRCKVQPSWDVLRDYGNLSSASVLFVLNAWMNAWMAGKKLKTGDRGLLAAFGPGFSAEMLLLQWI